MLNGPFSKQKTRVGSPCSRDSYFETEVELLRLDYTSSSTSCNVYNRSGLGRLYHRWSVYTESMNLIDFSMFSFLIKGSIVISTKFTSHRCTPTTDKTTCHVLYLLQVVTLSQPDLQRIPSVKGVQYSELKEFFDHSFSNNRDKKYTSLTTSLYKSR